MIAKAVTAALLGIDAYRIDLEVDLTRAGIPAFTMVGLAEGAVKESKERVFASLKNTGFKLPPSRITVNLAPADMRKEGSGYDLPLALGLLAAAGTLPPSALENVFLTGELSLAGELKPVPGVLPMALKACTDNAHAFLVPADNGPEASIVSGLNVIPIESLDQAVRYLLGEIDLEPFACAIEELWKSRMDFHMDYSEVKGQEHAKRAIEIAAAGAHNLLFMGPPGSGKTMLAKRIPSVLPSLEFNEALEVTKIYSVAGILPKDRPIIVTRPFRSPHHTISDAGLIGGGHYPRPGEVSLSHCGVLFLDELPEFKKHVLEVLRQPLEDGQVTIARAAMSLNYPADFMLVSAMNPCPCGFATDERHPCTCTPTQVQRYRGKISGPLLDRIDLQVEVPAVPYKDLKGAKSTIDSATMRKRIQAARQLQLDRYRDLPITTNAALSGKWLQQFCELSEAEHDFLEHVVKSLGLSARAYTRILRIGRTIADLEQASRITAEHLAEAINFRFLDREDI